MSRNVSDLLDQARGRWRGILLTHGMADTYLKPIHGPCPLCQGGEDRFRFDNREGKGTWFCNQCGHGDGFDLLQKFKGWDFATTRREVQSLLGVTPHEPPPKEAKPEEVRAMMKRLFHESAPIQKGDLADRYLTSRGVGQDRYPSGLRFHPRCWYAKEGEVNVFHPAMLGVVQDEFGNGVNIHRTYLTPDGEKLDRKVLRASIPGGCAIRLFKAGPVLGVAEGIETAYAAHKLFGIPVWSLLNAKNLASFKPPSEVEDLVIFGDNDRLAAGQAAAWALAASFAPKKGKLATVHIPTTIGYDWNDVLREQPSWSFGTTSHQPWSSGPVSPSPSLSSGGNGGLVLH